ncbi:hypothetical protein CP8484711_1554, partial [Chlamydia psittaci 84-8471/1]
MQKFFLLSLLDDNQFPANLHPRDVKQRLNPELFF